MPNSYPFLASRIFNTPLLIEPSKLQTILHVLGPRFGIDAPEPTLDMRAVDSREQRNAGYQVVNGKAVIPITGSLLARGGFMNVASGATTYGMIEQTLAMALEDDSAESIILEISSPGGEAELLESAGATISQINKIKPVTAVVNESAASAAYWLASQAGEIVVTPGARVGSIGVVWTHISLEGKAEKEGIQVTHIHAGDKKIQGSPYFNLSDQDKSDIQHLIDSTYDRFVTAVATGRGIDPEAVRATEAGIFTASEAIKLGLADRIASFASVLQAGNTAATSKGIAMSDKPIETVAQLREAHPQLCQEIHDDGFKAGSTNAKAEAQAETDNAVKAAINSERGRFAEVLSLPEAQGCEQMAMKLAAKGMNAEDAKEILESAPKAAVLEQVVDAPAMTFGSAMQQMAANPSVTPDSEPAESEVSTLARQLAGI